MYFQLMANVMEISLNALFTRYTESRCHCLQFTFDLYAVFNPVVLYLILTLPPPLLSLTLLCIYLIYYFFCFQN